MSTGEESCIAQAWPCPCVPESVYSLCGVDPPLNPLPILSFYSSRPGSYIETRGPTGGPEVVETLYII
jgi:hypothetical protein